MLDALVAQAGAGAAAVCEAWMDELEANGGVYRWLSLVLAKFAPAPVVEAVESAFKAGGPLKPGFDKLG